MVIYQEMHLQQADCQVMLIRKMLSNRLRFFRHGDGISGCWTSLRFLTQVVLFILFYFLSLFILRERGRAGISSRLCMVSMEHDSGLELKSWDHNLSLNQEADVGPSEPFRHLTQLILIAKFSANYPALCLL